MRLKEIILSIIFIFLSIFSFAQKPSDYVTINGIVEDKVINEPIIGAVIHFVGANMSTVTDVNGKYSISIPKGKKTIRVTFIGYDHYENLFDLKTNQTINIDLEQNNELKEIIVSSEAKNSNITDIRMGVDKLSIEQIRSIPAFMGEVDVIKAVQLLPGVQAASEGGSGFSVRGGSPDQNLILLDDTPVYNPSHLMGFFSVFNNDMIKNLELYKGDLPARYGGRLSSLLDIRTIDKRPKRFTGTGGLGLISSRLMLQGPIGSKTTWIVGGRRSYADKFLKFSRNEVHRDLTLYFYDANAKINHRFSNKDNLSLNIYGGRDNYETNLLAFRYGNIATSLTWAHTFSPSLHSKLNVNYAK